MYVPRFSHEKKKYLQGAIFERKLQEVITLRRGWVVEADPCLDEVEKIDFLIMDMGGVLPWIVEVQVTLLAGQYRKAKTFHEIQYQRGGSAIGVYLEVAERKRDMDRAVSAAADALISAIDAFAGREEPSGSRWAVRVLGSGQCEVSTLEEYLIRLKRLAEPKKSRSLRKRGLVTHFSIDDGVIIRAEDGGEYKARWGDIVRKGLVARLKWLKARHRSPIGVAYSTYVSFIPMNADGYRYPRAAFVCRAKRKHRRPRTVVDSRRKQSGNSDTRGYHFLFLAADACGLC